MQPFSYQSAETTCWVACMINGIRYLQGKDRVPTPVDRLLHFLLHDDGVNYAIRLDLDDPCRDRTTYRAALDSLEALTDLKFNYVCGNEVDEVIGDLEFNKKNVAVCDIGNGDHSILLVDKQDEEWFFAFDPYWYGPPGGRDDRQNLQFPVAADFVNVRIRQNHLLSPRLEAQLFSIGRAYQMGKRSSRFVTVIKKC